MVFQFLQHIKINRVQHELNNNNKNNVQRMHSVISNLLHIYFIKDQQSRQQSIATCEFKYHNTISSMIMNIMLADHYYSYLAIYTGKFPLISSYLDKVPIILYKCVYCMPGPRSIQVALMYAPGIAYHQNTLLVNDNG